MTSPENSLLELVKEVKQEQETVTDSLPITTEEMIYYYHVSSSSLW
jgi:hypothetical protein